MVVVQYTFSHKQYIEQHNLQQNNTISKKNTTINLGRVRAVPLLSELYIPWRLP